jgi:maleylacetoacetate isomerase
VGTVACDIHPICNIAVTDYLRQQHGAEQADIIRWYTTWMHRGFRSIERALAAENGPCCFGSEPSMADVFLVPQVFNARRFDIPMASFPAITRVVDHCLGLPAFADASPERQPDSAP